MNEYINLNGLSELFFQNANKLYQIINRNSNIKHIYIWGAGQNGRVVAALLKNVNIKVNGFFDNKYIGEILLDNISVFSEPTYVNKNDFIIIAMNRENNCEAIARIIDICVHNKASYCHIESEPYCKAYKKKLVLFKELFHLCRNEEVYIIGPDNSACEYDWTFFEGKNVLILDRALLGIPFHRFFPKRFFWFSVDPLFGTIPRKHFWSLPNNIILLGPPHFKYYFNKNLNFIAIDQQRINDFLISKNFIIPFTLCDSLEFVLLLVFYMGFSKIFLIGFDKMILHVSLQATQWNNIYITQSHVTHYFSPKILPKGSYIKFLGLEEVKKLQHRLIYIANTLNRYINIVNCSKSSEFTMFSNELLINDWLYS